MEEIAVDYLTYYKALCFISFLFTIFPMFGMVEVSPIGL